MPLIALAHHFHEDLIDAPIVGMTDVEHLGETVEALEIDLSASDIEYFEQPSEPVEVTTHE